MTAPSTLRCLAGCGPRRYLVAGPTWNPAFRWYGSRSRWWSRRMAGPAVGASFATTQRTIRPETLLWARAQTTTTRQCPAIGGQSVEWSASRRRSRLGNAMADDDLTYVYSYDRCEGNYWDSVAAGAKSPRPEERQSIAERAFAHCRVAAESGIAESCYKLGDFLRDGRGCEKDAPCRRQSARARALPA